MFSSSPTQELNEQLSYFLCKCGAEFDYYNNYYRHLMEQRRCPTESLSVNITKNYSNSSKVSANKLEHKYFSKESQESTILEAGFSDEEEDLKEDEQSEWKQSIQSEMKYVANSQSVTPVREKRRQLRRWNDFLILKNEKCKERPYFCGNCEIIYFQLQDLLSHCVNQCQSFEHPASSHLFTDPQTQRRRKLNQKIFSIKKAYSKVIEIDEGEEIDYFQLLSIYEEQRDHKNIDFVCGVCSFESINFGKYSSHMQRFQHGSNTKRGSHIILRLLINHEIKNIYLSFAVKWETEEAKYFCACIVHKKMKMKHLIQHVYVEHNGISPYYSIDFRNRLHEKYDKYFYENAKDEVVRSIITLHMAAKQRRFKCKLCAGHRVLNPNYYADHILRFHNRIVDPKKNSYILIEVKSNKCKLTHYFYLPIKVHNHDSSAKYYCPCQDDQKMSLKDFVEHILKQHNGVSPCYILDR